LPDHLPREEIVHHPGSVCPGCGPSTYGSCSPSVMQSPRHTRSPRPSSTPFACGF
jgi:hypothetical protein